MRTVSQIAATLGVKRDTIHKRIKRLGLTPRMVGHQMTFTPAQERKIMEAGKK